MSVSVRVRMKDGTARDFSVGRYTKGVEYVTGFVVILDEFGKRTSIPADQIEEIVEDSERGNWR